MGFPLSTDIFGQLKWLVKQVKLLVFRVTRLENGGAGSYKVFTALVTQNGGDDFQEQGFGAVTKGVSYYYDELFEGSDFTNVGGPKYGDLPNSGGYFIATATGVPNNYDGTTIGWSNGAPVVTVLENTIGNVWFRYDDVGVYSIYSDGLFTVGKTMLQGVTFYSSDNDNLITINTTSDSNSISKIYLNKVSANNSYIDGYLYSPGVPIEIRVYN